MKIKTKIVLPMVFLMVVVVGINSLLSANIGSNSLKKVTDTNMTTISEQGVKIVNSRIQDQKDIIELLSQREEIKDMSKTTEEKFSILREYEEKYNYIKMGITDLDGNIVYSNGTSANISDREYLNRARKGDVVVSNPLISSTEHILVVVYMSPIFVDGKIVGFLSATKDGNDISSISNDIKFGNTGNVFAIKNDGTKIAHYNNDLVTNADNDIENVKNDESLKQLADLENKMIKGETGSGEYKYNGVEKYMYYTPIEGTSWSLAVVMEKSEIYSELFSMQKIIILIALIFIVGSIAIVYFISNKISFKIKYATDTIIPIAQGDFTSKVDEQYLSIKDETGEMLRTVNNMKESIRKIISVVLSNSDEICNDSQILASNSEEMNNSTDSVVSAIKEVSAGTTSQSENLINVTEILDDFSNEINMIMDSLMKVEDSSKLVADLTTKGNYQFNMLSESIKEMTDSFDLFKEKIESSSKNINRINEITELINSIAEQTNLLALNAAIEAARAGETGKGFAVVADEIRTLSEQSKKSADSITKLIGTISNENTDMIITTKNVNGNFNKQRRTIEEAVTSFNNISDSIESVGPQIRHVSHALFEIKEKKDAIIQSVEATTAVSEQTSAASQEILASSYEIKNSTEAVAEAAKELENKASEMITQVKKFKI